MKETEDDSRKCKDICALGLEEFMLLKWPFFTKLEQIILKFVWNHKRLQIAKVILKKKRRIWRYHPPRHQTILQSHRNQNSMVLAQKQTQRSMEQNSPDINSHTYGQLIYNEGSKNIQWRKESLFNNWCWENWTVTCKTMRLEHFLIPH